MYRQIFFFLALLTSFVHAETRPGGDITSYLQNLGPITFSQGGGAFLPMSVLSGMSSGKVSPIVQFYITNDMINKCAKDVLANGAPGQLEPYVSAHAKWEKAQCKMTKCYNQAYLTSLLPQMSSNTAYGGSADAGARESNKNLGLVLAQAFQKQDKCVDGDEGLDPQLIAFFLSQSQQ